MRNNWQVGEGMRSQLVRMFCVPHMSMPLNEKKNKNKTKHDDDVDDDDYLKISDLSKITFRSVFPILGG